MTISTKPGPIPSRASLAAALGALWPILSTLLELNRAQTFIAYCVVGSVVIGLAHLSFERRDRWGLWCALVGIPVFALAIDVAHQVIYRLTPTTIDSTLLLLDARVVGDLTFRLSRWLWHHTIILVLADRCYLALGLVNSIVFALAYDDVHGEERAKEMLWLWGSAGALGAVGYFLFPAIGPSWVLHNWPATPTIAEMRQAVPWIAKPRNAMPSLHATWVFLILYSARWLSWRVWVLLLPWAVLTLMMTLGGGEHYAVDLLAAIPFSFTILVTFRLVASKLVRTRPPTAEPVEPASPPAVV